MRASLRRRPPRSAAREGFDGRFSVVRGVIDLPAKATDAVHPSVTFDPGDPIDGWTAAGPGVWRKQYDKTEGQTTGCGAADCGATETTKLELRHVPKSS